VLTANGTQSTVATTLSWHLASTVTTATLEAHLMDAERFDRLALAFGHRITRRTVLGLLASLGLTELGGQHSAG
jgi:hypothetical protein